MKNFISKSYFLSLLSCGNGDLQNFSSEIGTMKKNIEINEADIRKISAEVFHQKIKRIDDKIYFLEEQLKKFKSNNESNNGYIKEIKELKDQLEKFRDEFNNNQKDNQSKLENKSDKEEIKKISHELDNKFNNFLEKNNLKSQYEEKNKVFNERLSKLEEDLKNKTKELDDKINSFNPTSPSNPSTIDPKDIENLKLSVENLKKEIEDLKKGNSNPGTPVNTEGPNDPSILNSKITELKNEVGDLREEIEKNKKILDEKLKSEIENVNEKIKKNADEISKINSEIEKLREAIKKIEDPAKVTGAPALTTTQILELSQLQSKFAALEGKMENQFNDIKNKLDDMKKEIEDKLKEEKRIRDENLKIMNQKHEEIYDYINKFDKNDEEMKKNIQEANSEMMTKYEYLNQKIIKAVDNSVNREEYKKILEDLKSAKTISENQARELEDLKKRHSESEIKYQKANQTVMKIIEVTEELNGIIEANKGGANLANKAASAVNAVKDIGSKIKGLFR